VLDWRSSTTVGLHLFLCPTLRHCTLDDWISFPPSDLKSITASCPILENLFLGSFFFFEQFRTPVLSEITRSYNRLKHLTCPLFDSTAWEYLFHLPTLQTVTVIEVDEVLSIGDNVKFGPFLNVATLSFDSTSASGIIMAIQHSFPSLKRFEMNVDLLPWAEADQLFHALTQCNACDTIEDINISSEFESSDPCEPLTVVRQFLCFPRLRKLELFISPYTSTITFFYKPCRVGRTFNIYI
jgi:hypothetical protein